MTDVGQVNGQLSGSRSRPQARKKVNDDFAYAGPTLSAAARQGVKRLGDVEGERPPKRQRMAASGTGAGASGSARRADRDRPAAGEGAPKSSLVDFSTMPTSAIYRYLSYFDLIPTVHPSPLSAKDPPPPSSLQNAPRHSPRPPSPTAATTPANRPRRDPKDANRRRSSRLSEEEEYTRTPILADVGDVHDVLAKIAARHFEQHSVREVDTLATFISLCKLQKTMA